MAGRYPKEVKEDVIRVARDPVPVRLASGSRTTSDAPRDTVEVAQAGRHRRPLRGGRRLTRHRHVTTRCPLELLQHGQNEESGLLLGYHWNPVANSATTTWPPMENLLPATATSLRGTRRYSYGLTLDTNDRFAQGFRV